MSDQPPELPDDRPYDRADDPDSGLEPEPGEITAQPASDETDVPHPVNWRTLTAEDAEYEWLALNEWVDWLRHDFGLPASIIPPYRHRHPELVWELSALHLHWLGAYDPAQHASAPIGWLAGFHAARQRLREWVALSGTRLDRDRPTRQTALRYTLVRYEQARAEREQDEPRLVALPQVEGPVEQRPSPHVSACVVDRQYQDRAPAGVGTPGPRFGRISLGLFHRRTR